MLPLQVNPQKKKKMQICYTSDADCGLSHWCHAASLLPSGRYLMRDHMVAKTEKFRQDKLDTYVEEPQDGRWEFTVKVANDFISRACKENLLKTLASIHSEVLTDIGNTLT